MDGALAASPANLLSSHLALTWWPTFAACKLPVAFCQPAQGQASAPMLAYLGRKSSATGTPGPRCLGSKKKACTERPSGVWKVIGCKWEGARGQPTGVRA